MDFITTEFISPISSIEDIPTNNKNNPYITVAKFIYADNKPNGNKQAIPTDELEGTAKSLVGMPVKMAFTGLGVAEHAGSIPIGHVTKAEVQKVSEDLYQISAEASLWKEEFPDAIEWLQQKYKSGEAPGISLEAIYDSRTSFMENGVQWLKNVVATAATFVKSPAYGRRTALLALASLKDDQKLNDAIITMASKIVEEAKDQDNKGGITQDMTDKEKLELEQALASAKKEAEEASKELSTVQASLKAFEEENKSLKEKVSTLETQIFTEERVGKYIAAGFKLPEGKEGEDKKAVFASFNDAQFDIYLADLVAARPKSSPSNGAQVLASLGAGVPRPDVDNNVEPLDFARLKTDISSLGR